jgi:hypothetical protein
MLRYDRTIVAVLLLCGCQSGEQSKSAQATDAAGQPAAVARFTIADFQVLRYVEGDWRGSGPGADAFYESYRFTNDSTIEMIAWSDSTLTTQRETSQYLYRDGAIRTSAGARLVKADGEGHHFQESNCHALSRLRGVPKLSQCERRHRVVHPDGTADRSLFALCELGTNT